MRKIYTLLLALLIAGTVSARQLTFYKGTAPIAPGAVIASTQYEVEDIGGGYKALTIDPDLYLGTDIYSSKIKVSAVCTSGQDIQMCAGGKCEAGKSVVKENVTIQTGNKIPLQLEYINYELAPGEAIPTLTVEIEAQDVEHPETLVKMTVVMGPDAAAGLTEIVIPNEVRSTRHGIEYNLASPATISIYSITGTQVLAVKASGRGSVSTHSLRPGIYIYAVNGATRTTGKLHVR